MAFSLVRGKLKNDPLCVRALVFDFLTGIEQARQHDNIPVCACHCCLYCLCSRCKRTGGMPCSPFFFVIFIGNYRIRLFTVVFFVFALADKSSWVVVLLCDCPRLVPQTCTERYLV